MFELGPEKLLMLLLICLVIFGGKRLPEIGDEVRTPAPAPATSDAAAHDDMADSRPEPKRLT